MQSMTGYGKETSRQGDWEMTVELRAVNHRFLDLSMRLGRGLTFLEETIRKTLAPLCRGHVDVQLTLRRISGSDSDVTVDAVAEPPWPFAARGGAPVPVAREGYRQATLQAMLVAAIN